MRKEKRTRKRFWEPLGDKAKSSEGGEGEYNVNKWPGNNQKYRGGMKSSRRMSKAEMQQDA